MYRTFKIYSYCVISLYLQGKEVEVAVASKVIKESKKKGDLMANDAEMMEYSSEDISDDDLDDMNYAGYKNKRRRVRDLIFPS